MNQRDRDRARFELVLSGHSELGFGDRAAAEAERLAWYLVNTYNEVVVISPETLAHLRNPSASTKGTGRD